MQTTRLKTTPPQLPRSQERRSGAIGAWLIGSAALALGLAYLPIGTGTSSASVITPASAPRAIGMTISNSALKGDRLGVAHQGAFRKEGSEAGGKIPVGCEAAFSKLVRIGNFTSRCVT